MNENKGKNRFISHAFGKFFKYLTNCIKWEFSENVYFFPHIIKI